MSLCAGLAICGYAIAQEVDGGEASIQAKAADAPNFEWPRVIQVPQARIVIYEPQLESFKGDLLAARAAVSVTPTDSEAPVFGAVWLTGRVAVDREARTVNLLSVSVTDVKFPTATDDQREKLKTAIEVGARSWDLTMSLDQLLSAVEMAEKEKAAAEKLDNTPPKILVSKVPAVLVTIDGEPKLKKIEKTDLLQVLNTPFFMAMDPASKSYYLKAGQYWMKADQVAGPWKLTDSAPAAAIAAADGKDTTGLSGPASVAQPEAAEVVPEVLVSTEPAELFVLDGDAEFQVIPDTNLLYVSNTDRDVFLELGSQSLYIVVSGRWYTAKSKEGPWTYVPSRELPADFARIPPGSPKSNVLASIPDTDEAKEAIANASIPETAAINRDEAKLEVTYDGEPKFEPIEGTAMEYGLNTSYSVVKAERKYYCCDNAVWFESDSPNGPWMVCVSVAKEIYTIPPSCPLYPVKYVYVYHSTPTVVYVGYTPGYVGCYVYGGCVIYGTGYVYRPWYGTVYYPRPATYGYRFHYNGSSGNWAVGVAAVGPNGWVVVGRGSGYGGVVAGGWWGNGGVVVTGRPIATPYKNNVNIKTGDITINRNVNNIQGGGINNIQGGGINNRTGNAAAPGRTLPTAAERPRPTQLPAESASRKNDLFADRDGNVVRKGLDGWERPTTTTSPASRPTQQPAARMDEKRGKELDNQLKARSQGDARTQQSVQNRATQGAATPASRPATPTTPRPAATPGSSSGKRGR